MSEQVQELPAARSPLARLMGVIISPGETFQDIERRPGWLFPMVTYMAIFAICFGVYAMKADWIGIVTEQIEENPFMSFAPEDRRDTIIDEALAGMRKQSQGQMAADNVINVTATFVPFYHLMTLVYCTLFVMTGSLTSLRLGGAWLNFLLCLLLLIGYWVIIYVARSTFSDAPQSALLLIGLGAVAMTGGWIWLLNRQTAKDEVFHKMLSVGTYATAVGIIGSIAMLGVSLATEGAIDVRVDRLVTSSLGQILKPEGTVIRAVLDRIDVFSLWTLTVLTIGYRAVTRLSTGVTASITLLPWGVYSLFMIALAAVFG